MTRKRAPHLALLAGIEPFFIIGVHLRALVPKPGSIPHACPFGDRLRREKAVRTARGGTIGNTLEGRDAARLLPAQLAPKASASRLHSAVCETPEPRSLSSNFDTILPHLPTYRPRSGALPVSSQVAQIWAASSACIPLRVGAYTKSYSGQYKKSSSRIFLLRQFRWASCAIAWRCEKTYGWRWHTSGRPCRANTRGREPRTTA